MSAQDSLIQKIQMMVDDVSRANLETDIKALESPAGLNSRVNFTPGVDSAAVYIKKQFDMMPGLTSVEVDTFYEPSADPPFNTKPIFNIIATLEGASGPNVYYLAGAHYDCSASRMGNNIWNSQWQTIDAPGADDNATGVAAILEMARIMSDPANNFVNDYTIKFIAFGAEESGPAHGGNHLGSLHYAAEARDLNHNILGMVSIDMIGYNNFYDYNSIVADNSSQWFAGKFVEVNSLFNIELTLDDPPFPYATYSDHASFWDYGYKAILFIENAPPWSNGTYYQRNIYYHTSVDTFGTLNMELVTKVTKLNLAAFAAFSAVLSDVPDTEEGINPADFALYQNYPNPFNPSTVIGFNISEASDVRLTVYNSLGEEIEMLHDGYLEAGEHSSTFSADGLVSGIYLYRLEVSGNFSGRQFQTARKMMLIK
jgi:hypothetical protein